MQHFNIFCSSQIFVLLEETVYSRPPQTLSPNVNLRHYARTTFVILSPPEADEESLNSLRLRKTRFFAEFILREAEGFTMIPRPIAFKVF
jgi:hypothetical protein